MISPPLHIGVSEVITMVIMTPSPSWSLIPWYGDTPIWRGMGCTMVLIPWWWCYCYYMSRYSVTTTTTNTPLTACIGTQ